MNLVASSIHKETDTLHKETDTLHKETDTLYPPTSQPASAHHPLQPHVPSCALSIPTRLCLLTDSYRQ
jgi:hypothetical protein